MTDSSQSAQISAELKLSSDPSRCQPPVGATYAQNIIHSSLVAMRQLTRQSVITWPCHKLLTLSLRKGLTAAKIQAIDVKTIKSAINEVAVNTLPPARAQVLALICSIGTNTAKRINNHQVSSINSNDILKQQFDSFTEKIIQGIRAQLQHSEIMSAVDLAWNSQSLRDIFDNNKDLIGCCSNIRQILSLAKVQVGQNPEKSEEVAGSQKEVLQFKLLLAKLSGNTKAKVDLYKLFESKNSLLQTLSKQEEQWMLCCKDLEATVNSQMQHIEAQELEKESLETVIEELNQQLMQTGERMKAVEGRIRELEQELEEVKQPAAQTDTYYMNPMYDRTQFEEKILMEMIEFESDLLLGKEQIQLMTDAIVELIKLASFSLEDLQATKYFLGTFHRSVYRVTKDIKSMENIDLEHLLCLKDDTHSFYDSELGMEETRRSQISNRSEAQLDQKLSRITEDDSLSTIHSD